MGKDPYNRTLVLFSRGKLTRNYIPEVVGTLATFSAGYGLLGMISYPAILAYLATMGVGMWMIM